MSSFNTLDMPLLAEFFTFKQKGEESFKNAWDRISGLHQKIQPMLAMCVLLRCFYYGLSDACKHALDVITGGNFLEIDELESLRIIKGLVVFPTNEKTNGIHGRLDKIENILCNLNLNGIEEGSKDYQILEISGGWEPYIPIEINDQRLFAYCDIGSMMSTMPRMVFNAMNFGDLFNYPFCHSHSDGIS